MSPIRVRVPRPADSRCAEKYQNICLSGVATHPGSALAADTMARRVQMKWFAPCSTGLQTVSAYRAFVCSDFRCMRLCAGSRRRRATRWSDLATVALPHVEFFQWISAPPSTRCSTSVGQSAGRCSIRTCSASCMAYSLGKIVPIRGPVLNGASTPSALVRERRFEAGAHGLTDGIARLDTVHMFA